MRPHGLIMMILTYIIDIDETLKLTQGQGQRSMSYRHICEKIVLAITHEHMDES